MKHPISGNWGQHVQVQASEVAKARMIWAPDLLLLTDRWINPQRFSLNSWRNGPILTNLHFAGRRLLSCCVFVCTSCMQGNILLWNITAWRQCVCKALWLPGTWGSAFPCFPCFLLFFFLNFACISHYLGQLFFLRFLLGTISYPSVSSPIKMTSDSPLSQTLLKNTCSHNLYCDLLIPTELQAPCPPWWLLLQAIGRW